MDQYLCNHCNRLYDAETDELRDEAESPKPAEPDEVFFDRVDPITALPGTPLDEVPADWICPECRKNKTDF